MRASRCDVSPRRTTCTWPASRSPSSRIAARIGFSSTMTILSEGCMGAGDDFQAACQARRAQILKLYQFVECQTVDRPKIRRCAHGGILGSSAQQGCSANPWRSNVHRGAFRLRPNRAFISARWFSPDAPPERPRSLDEQGAAWNKAWQCGGFEVPAIVAAGSLRNFKSKTTLES